MRSLASVQRIDVLDDDLGSGLTEPRDAARATEGGGLIVPLLRG
jgi:hypothetical protein